MLRLLLVPVVFFVSCLYGAEIPPEIAERIRQQMDERRGKPLRLTVDWDFSATDSDGKRIGPKDGVYGEFTGIVYVRSEDGTMILRSRNIGTLSPEMEPFQFRETHWKHGIENRRGPGTSKLIVGVVPLATPVSDDDGEQWAVMGEVEIDVTEDRPSDLSVRVPLRPRRMVKLNIDRDPFPSHGTPMVVAYKFPGTSVPMVHVEGKGAISISDGESGQLNPILVPESLPLILYRDEIVRDSKVTWQGVRPPFIPEGENPTVKIPLVDPPAVRLQFQFADGVAYNLSKVTAVYMFLDDGREFKPTFLIGNHLNGVESGILITDYPFMPKYGGQTMARYPAKISRIRLYAKSKSGAISDTTWDVANEARIQSSVFFEEHDEVIIKMKE